MIGLFRTLRGVLIDGVAHKRDELLRLEDAELIGQLLESGKIAPADKATEKRVKWRSPIIWKSGEPREPGERNPWRRCA